MSSYATWSLTVVCPAALRDSVNTKMMEMNRGPTFTAGLSPIGDEGGVATHYWASHNVTENEFNKLAVLLAEELSLGMLGIFWDTSPDNILQELGLKRI